jgi:hypothetical protein
LVYCYFAGIISVLFYDFLKGGAASVVYEVPDGVGLLSFPVVNGGKVSKGDVTEM